MRDLLTNLLAVPLWIRIALGIVILAGLLGLGYLGLQFSSESVSNSSPPIRRWFNNPSSREAWITSREQCSDAPFILPSAGLIGLLWRDPAGPYSALRRHTGVDIFGNGEPGEVPVYAVYDGYLSRLDNWLSSVIIQHDDPLQPGRKIWTYYTHMASEDGDTSFIEDDFPPGTAGKFVEQGTLLGYQGEYAGNVNYTIGVHVHFSIVKSEANGTFTNEADLDNTLDPSPYFGMALNIDDLPARPIRCKS